MIDVIWMVNDSYKDTVSFGGDSVRNIGAHRRVRNSRFWGMEKTLGSCRDTESSKKNNGSPNGT